MSGLGDEGDLKCLPWEGPLPTGSKPGVWVRGGGAWHSEMGKQLPSLPESLCCLLLNTEGNLGAEESDSRGGPGYYPNFLVLSD